MSQTVRWVLITCGGMLCLVAAIFLLAPEAEPERVHGASADVASTSRGVSPAPPASVAPIDAGAPTESPPSAPLHASESALMAEASASLADAPARTLLLIAQADRRFGAVHEARRLLEIEALVKLERIGESHAKAEHFYRQFPGGASAQRIERLTGYHPRPWGPGQ